VLSKLSVLDFQMQMKVRRMEPTKAMRHRRTFGPVPRARWRMTRVIASRSPLFHSSFWMSDLSRVLLHTHAEEQMRKQKLSTRLMTSSAVLARSLTCKYKYTRTAGRPQLSGGGGGAAVVSAYISVAG
jgi:hypothetical protein